MNIDNISYFQNNSPLSVINPVQLLWVAITALITSSPLFALLFISIGLEGYGIVLLIQMFFFTDTLMIRYKQLQRSVRIITPIFCGAAWSIILSIAFYIIKYRQQSFDKLDFSTEKVINELKEGLMILNLFSIGLIFILFIVFLIIRCIKES